MYYNTVEAIFWESKKEPSRPLKFKVGHGSFLENGFKVTLRSKTNVLSIWKKKFSVFSNFWVTKLKPLFGKVRENIKSCLNQNLVIGSFLENGIEATLSSKLNVPSIWKGHFSVFWKFLHDEVETVF